MQPNNLKKQIEAIRKVQDIRKPSETKEIRTFRGDKMAISAYNNPNVLKIEDAKYGARSSN